MYEAFGGQTHRNRLSFLKVTPSDVRGSVKVGPNPYDLQERLGEGSLGKGTRKKVAETLQPATPAI